ncbi:HSP20-like chaperone [Fistulina hepatica ATCC 64428]|uniref:HSP20-like chaperone n=1 Tax=Fistulina hepatica ATCC 64428 TaxID=1128425 RepID=A0A0D7ACM3_9AGAR|nr:HSP20-like chaperone [Fistulina hepatica ATCC 64428]
MSISRLFNEFRPLFRMLDEPITHSPAFGRSVFDDPFFRRPSFPSFTHRSVAVDLSEEKDKYILEAEVPGVKKENLEIRIGDSGRSVTIQGSVSSRSTEPSTGTESGDASTGSAEGAQSYAFVKTEAPSQLSTERSFVGQFTRTLWLPRPVDASNVQAKLNDGVLTITVPKAEDKASVVIPVE